MKEKRAVHKEKISAHHEHKQKLSNEFDGKSESTLKSSDANDLKTAFNEIVLPKKRKIDDLYKPKKKPRKDENYINYTPADKHTEEGLSVNNFQTEANKAQLDLTGDSVEAMRFSKQTKKWDRKKKKMVTVQDSRHGKIKTEAGVWISASYKSNRYADWKEKTRVDQNEQDDNETEEKESRFSGKPMNTHWARHNEKVKQKQRKSELKSTDQILKQRLIAEKKRQRQNKKGKSKGKGARKSKR